MPPIVSKRGSGDDRRSSSSGSSSSSQANTCAVDWLKWNSGWRSSIPAIVESVRCALRRVSSSGQRHARSRCAWPVSSSSPAGGWQLGDGRQLAVQHLVRPRRPKPGRRRRAPAAPRRGPRAAPTRSAASGVPAWRETYGSVALGQRSALQGAAAASTIHAAASCSPSSAAASATSRRRRSSRSSVQVRPTRSAPWASRASRLGMPNGSRATISTAIENGRGGTRELAVLGVERELRPAGERHQPLAAEVEQQPASRPRATAASTSGCSKRCTPCRSGHGSPSASGAPSRVHASRSLPGAQLPRRAARRSGPPSHSSRCAVVSSAQHRPGPRAAAARNAPRRSRSGVSHAMCRHGLSRTPSLTPRMPASSNSRWSELPVSLSRCQSTLEPTSSRSTPRRGAATGERRQEPRAGPDLVERERVAQPLARHDPRQRTGAQVVGRAGVEALLGARGDQPHVARSAAQARRERAQHPEPGRVVLRPRAGRHRVGVGHDHAQARPRPVEAADHVARAAARASRTAARARSAPRHGTPAPPARARAARPPSPAGRGPSRAIDTANRRTRRRPAPPGRAARPPRPARD